MRYINWKKPALTRADNVLCLVTKINGFPRFMVEHFCVKFGDPSCIGFRDTVWKNRQTNKQTHKMPLKAVPRDYRWRR